MKQFQDYKKQFNLILISIAILAPLFFIDAQNVADLQNKINQKDGDIASLEREIAIYQAQLNVINEEKSSLTGEIKKLDLTRKKLLADINLTQNKIDKTNLTIEELSGDIGNKELSIDTSIESIKAGIRLTNEFEGTSLIGIILSNDDLSTTWKDIDQIMTVRDEIRRNISTLKIVKGELEDTRYETVQAKTKLVELKNQLGAQQKIIVQNTNEKNKLLAQTKNSESNYQKLLKDRIAQRDAFEQELRDYEAQLKYILDPSKLPTTRVLSWPLDYVYVTQMFGKTVDSVRLYASGSHSGVDFRAAVGTPVRAMADGRVLGTGDTDQTCYGASFGKYVFIEYSNGLSSTYGHLSIIKSREGDTVKRGEVVGYSGNTGHSTGPHLHVSLYASEAVQIASKPSQACGGRVYRLPVAATSAYLDALAYLPPYVKP